MNVTRFHSIPALSPSSFPLSHFESFDRKLKDKNGEVGIKKSFKAARWERRGTGLCACGGESGGKGGKSALQPILELERGSEQETGEFPDSGTREETGEGEGGGAGDGL